MKILILGHNGMLGHMVKKYLTKFDNNILTTELRWPNDNFKDFIKSFNGDFIINCIGAIHQRKNSFDVNWELPIFLDFYSSAKIIHPGTDCEIDTDNYGVSKKIAKDFILKNGKRTKSITTSIIGPELNTNSSLMNWFLNQKPNSEICCYNQYFWNGNTTLTWSQWCYKIINNWNSYDIDTTLVSETISKKEILDSLNEVFNKKIIINNCNTIIANKCLHGNIKTKHIHEQILELKTFYYV
jgi:dTDP-4-dehydrorhamnose reductase